MCEELKLRNGKKSQTIQFKMQWNSIKIDFCLLRQLKAQSSKNVSWAFMIWFLIDRMFVRSVFVFY